MAETEGHNTNFRARRRVIDRTFDSTDSARSFYQLLKGSLEAASRVLINIKYSPSLLVSLSDPTRTIIIIPEFLAFSAAALDPDLRRQKKKLLTS